MLRAIVLFFSVVAAFPAAAGSALDALVEAYPDHLVSHDDSSVTWKDGTVMPVGDRTKRSFEELLNTPTILDQFAKLRSWTRIRDAFATSRSLRRCTAIVAPAT
jgi:hypothetical protein